MRVASQDVLTLAVPVSEPAEVVQQHTIDFVPAGEGADLRIRWDRTQVRVPLRPPSE